VEQGLTDFFDFVGPHYELYRAVDPSRVAARAQAVVDFVDRARRPRNRLAELCCGDGRHSRALAGHGMEVVGVDRSDVLLKRARSLTHPDSRVSFLQQDLLELELGEPVDVAVAFGHSFGLALDAAVTCRHASRVRSNVTACGLAYLHVFETPDSPMPAPLERTLRLTEGTLHEQVVYDIDRRERSTDVTIRKDDGVVETAQIVVRTWRADQLSALLAEAGLETLETTMDEGALGSSSGFGVWVTPA
jgi:hypothetical protein